MYFKVEKGTETFSKLETVFSKVVAANKEAFKLVESLGFNQYCRADNGCGGGITALYSETKPENYKVVGKSCQNLYYPKVSQKITLNLISELPIIERDELNDTIGFKQQFVGMIHYRSFGVKLSGDVYIIDMHNECEYTPTSDMIEILTSEYKALSK